MGRHGTAYHPLDVLKPVAADVWIVDGQEIGFGPPGLKLPFPTRMTIVRVEGRLFVHSPTALTPELQRDVAALGSPAWIVAPSTIHYWWIPEWKAAFPDAEVYLAPGIVERSGGRVAMPHRPLDRDGGYPWDEEIGTLPIVGRAIAEVEFFHHRSRTLILTDLIENFEKARLRSLWARLLTRVGGVRDPHGSMPRDMRLTFLGRRRELKRAVQQMIAWNPHRIVLAHGRWYDEDGRKELVRAFGWLLGSGAPSAATVP